MQRKYFACGYYIYFSSSKKQMSIKYWKMVVNSSKSLLDDIKWTRFYQNRKRTTKILISIRQSIDSFASVPSRFKSFKIFVQKVTTEICRKIPNPRFVFYLSYFRTNIHKSFANWFISKILLIEIRRISCLQFIC